ncbi:bucky ball [Aulostomus maculatus]
MDDASKQSNSFGSGQQRPHHPRPFFYVQPPSQPYYLYQHWQMNNPYSHYGLPGGYGRPFLQPYQYMQYPGFMVPHAPLYPMEYRRMFEPRFHTPTWADVPRQQQQQQHPPPQCHGRREMACSEVQTDPSDAITKLMECLDTIRASELQGAERELDSGVASQSSGLISPGEKTEGQSDAHLPPSADSPAVVFSDSTTAVYDAESSQRNLDSLSPPVCWSGGLEEELPLDSSSVHEECPDLEQSADEDHFLPQERSEVRRIQTDICVTDLSVPKCDAEVGLTSPPATAKEKSGAELFQTASLDEAEQSYRITRLPFESVFTSEAAGAGRLPSPATPYYYNYLSMQTTHERMSVLSPSLDELSSRDEMFSTDLEDVDLFPKHVYAGGRLAEVVGVEAAEEVEEVWLPGAKQFLCACCGKNLAKGGSRVKGHKMYRDEAPDSEEESRYGRGCKQSVRVVVRKHSAPRKTHPGPLRHAAKPWYKRGQYKDPSDPVEQEEGRDLCKQESADGEIGEMTSSALQCRTCQGRLCREDLATPDQCRWGDGSGIPRRRQTALLQRHELSAQRTATHQRPREDDNDDNEPPSLHWERGRCFDPSLTFPP